VGLPDLFGQPAELGEVLFAVRKLLAPSLGVDSEDGLEVAGGGLQRRAGGAIRYGTTYMVLPADAARIRFFSNARISPAGRQLLYTPWSAGLLVATNVRSSERAVSLT
jgi:hypothetical protein